MTPIKQGSCVDMHIHTTTSDGSCSPSQVVELAVEQGLSGIAITDHDTTDGFAEANQAGQKLGIPVLAGIEISLDFVNNTHLLAYFPNGYQDEFVQAIKALKQYRKERIPKILAKLADLGCPLELDEIIQLAGNGQVGRPHIARALVARGYVASVQQAFDRYLASSSPAYVRKKKFSAEEAIPLINQNSGIPVLAHPTTMEMDMKLLPEQIQKWKQVGLRGVETFYSDFSQADHEFMEAIADQEGLLKTGGTDFHGISKPHILLGKGKGNLKVPAEYFHHVLAFAGQSRPIASS